FSQCQMEILSILSGTSSVEEARRMIPECVNIFLKYAQAIGTHRIALEDLVFTRRLSKKPEAYTNKTLESSVGRQWIQQGAELHAGQTIKYIITDYARRRAVAIELFDREKGYDSKRYIELLADVCSSVLEPFDYRCNQEHLMRIFTTSKFSFN
ncbi:MAG TPA: DNA polymerase domain-containing protein, partial [Candidatus Hodarchaeales archaeon]|nr:DNA polymerase domain-containing protein [Candidatus Hodarchaeales archaeon]